MVKHEVAKLEKEWLDLAVAMALGHNPIVEPKRRKNRMPCWRDGDVWIGVDGDRGARCFLAVSDDRADYFEPSTDWAQGGPLIDQHKIWLSDDAEGWIASAPPHANSAIKEGSTPLIAAMRCLVAAHFGEWAELPEIGG